MTQAPNRVLFISHAYVVGVNQGKLEAIARTGSVVVGLLAPRNWKALEWNRLLPLEQPAEQIQSYSAEVLFSGRGGAHLYAPWRLWQVLQDFRPDVVQVEEEVFSLCAFEVALWAKLARKPLVIFGWENLDRNLPLPRHWVRKFVLNTARLIIAGNQDGALLLRRWGYSGRVEVMPQMGVDPEFFAPRPRPMSAPKPEFKIGFLGRLVPEKGVDTLLTAMGQLKRWGIPCQLILCGGGSAEAELRQIAEQQQVTDRVIWRDSIPHHEVPEVLSQFDVLVLPSRTSSTWKEQFGHVLIEAMAMGIPAVGSDSGEIPNVIHRADLVFPEGDAIALAVILQQMVNEPGWREEVARYGFERVQQHYTHDRIAARLIDLWRSLLESPKTVAPLAIELSRTH